MVYNIHYTRPKWNGECLPTQAFGELNVIEAFLIWQGQHTTKIDGIIALRESNGRSLIMVETPTGDKLFSFRDVYKYFSDNGLFYI
jgi:hypothetical protein